MQQQTPSPSQPSRRSKQTFSTKKLTTLAMMTAIALVLVLLVRFPIFPSAAFLKYDPMDIVMLLAGLFFGPAEGLGLVVVASVLQGVLLDSADGFVGILMHILSSGALVLTASLIYRRFHTKKGAAIALLCASLVMCVVMVGCNLYFTVKFYGVPMEALKAMLIPIIIPFNLIKAGVNSMITYFIYKSFSTRLKKRLFGETDPTRPANPQ